MDRERDPRQLAASVLEAWEAEGGKVDEVRDRFLAAGGELEERDRALVTELVYGVVRHLPELDGELKELVHGRYEKMQRPLKAILRIGLYQLRHLDRIPPHAAVSEAVSAARQRQGARAAGLVNGVLRKAASRAGERAATWSGEEGPQARWREKWAARWGAEKADALLRYFRETPKVGLRRNRLRTGSDEEWLALLREEGAEPEPLVRWPGYAYVQGVRPGALPSFRVGKTTAQDPAAGIAVAMVQAEPGQRVLDLCAAPGGKGAALWEAMEGRGELVCLDRDPRRTGRMEEGFRRLGHDGIEVVTADLLAWEGAPGDRVLVDVPCSGTGVAHRRPDLLLRRGPDEIEALGRLQRKLLQRAAELVRPGGLLIYSTCSLEPEENETITAEFDQRAAKSFRRLDPPETIPPRWRREGAAATWPPEHGVDGAYAVRWRRET